MNFRFRLEHPSQLSQDERKFITYAVLYRFGYDRNSIGEMDAEEVDKIATMADFLEERFAKRIAIEISKVMSQMMR